MPSTAAALIQVDPEDPAPRPSGLPGRLGPCTTEHLITTRSGRRVVVWKTEPLLPGHRHRHPVIVAPGFARPMADMAGVALGLAVNGLTTYRFDPLDHVGLSDGTIRSFTMSAGVESLEAVCAFTRADSGATPSYLATSLSARYVVRHVAGRNDVHAVVLVVGVLNAWRTLRLVFGPDFATGGLDSLPPTVRFDGHEIDPVHLWHDDVANDWATLAGALADLARVQASVTGIYATDDPWVDILDARAALGSRHTRKLIELATDDHELFANPSHGATAITTAAAALIGHHTKPARLLSAPAPVVRRTIQLERAALADPDGVLVNGGVR
jgi:hypothetical protein